MRKFIRRMRIHGELVLLIFGFALALFRKLVRSERKYGWGGGWKRNYAERILRLDIRRRLAKGDPIDVAAYAAFAWHHGWSTSMPDGELCLARTLSALEIAEIFRVSPGQIGLVSAEAGRKTAPELCKLAHEIAVTSAISMLESNSIPEKENGVEWWNFAGEENQLEDLEPELTYLDKLGLIERHPTQADWLRVTYVEGE
jgi:hypothetical protein